MKRLRRTSRWTTRRQKHSAAGSLSCLPVSLLCRGLPSSPSPPVKESSVTAASSHHQRFTTVDDVNHVDRRPCGNVEQPGKNGTALLGGNGLQSYDNFIATLLKERSLVKDGVAANTQKLHVNKSSQTLTRLRQRRLLTDRTEDEPKASGYDGSSLLGVGLVRKSADDGSSSSLKSAEKQFISVVSKDVWVSTMDKYVYERQPQTEPDAGWSTTETTTDVVRNTSTKLDSLDCSPQQRQRQRRRKPKAGRQGATTVTEGCDSATPQTPVQDDYSVTKESATTLVGDSVSEHCDKVAVDRRQDTGHSGHDLTASCAYRGRFDRVDTMTTSHDPDYEQFRRTPAFVSDDCTPTSRRNIENSHQRHEEEAVDLLRFPVDSPIIPFIDCDSVEEVEEEQTKITSLVIDRWKNIEDEVTYSSLKTRASSLQFGGRVTGMHMPDSFRESPVCRRSTLTQCDETTVHARRCKQCRFYPSLTRSAIDQISELDTSVASLGQPTRGARTLRGSQLLETCKCSISWPVTTVPVVVHSDDMNSELNERRSPHMTRRPIQNRNTTADVSAAPQFNLEMFNDVKHPTFDCQQHLVGAFTSLPSNNVAQLQSYYPLTNAIGANRRDVQIHGVFARRRQEKAVCGSKTSKCLLRIEFMLTCSQVEDQRTTIVFVRRNTTEEHDRVVACDSGEADDVENLSFSYSSTCSTSDVMLTVTTDDIDDVINDAEQHVDTTGNSTAMDVVKSLTISQPSSIDGAFANSPRNSAYSAADAAHLAADIGAVNASMPREITSGNLDDVSQSLTVYEFAEVTSIFRHFDADLLPTTSRELSVVPYGTARREGGCSSMALVPRAAPGVTYSGAVVPYVTPSPVSFPLPLMTWTWSRDDFSGSRQQETHDDVTHIPYVSACTTLNVEPLIDHFTLVGFSSRSICLRHERAVYENMAP